RVSVPRGDSGRAADSARRRRASGSNDEGGADGGMPAAALPKPRLVFFHSRASGRARRVDGFLANVLQRRQNHDTFTLLHVVVEEQPELAGRFGIANAPTLVVLEGKRVCGRLEDPRGTGEIEEFLGPWLRRGRERGGADGPGPAG
ncbi:MAG: thioredoxin family protein, partial [Actinomycetota bacterium]|nr:thioredoxin family protein [Actinomycetota bacterium]